MNKKYLSLIVTGSMVLGIALATSTSSLLPTSDGAYSSWTPSTGSTHYNLVNESICDSLTSYVSTSATGNRDSYPVSLSSIPNGATITDITITPCASKLSGLGNSSMSLFYRLNGTNSGDSTEYTLTKNKPFDLAGTTYSGLNISKNASTTLEIGSVLVSGTAGARLSRLETVITYTVSTTTPPSTPVNLQATATGTNVFLTWTDTSSNELGFFIERGTSTANFVLFATTTANVTSYLNTGLTSGTYYYRIQAYNTAGFSGYSSTTMVTLP